MYGSFLTPLSSSLPQINKAKLVIEQDEEISFDTIEELAEEVNLSLAQPVSPSC